MSMSLLFDRRAALEAGLLISVVPNLTSDQLALIDEQGEDPEYIKWANGLSYVVHVPTTDLKVVDQLQDTGSSTIDITANKYGSVYQPMVDWLTSNNIPYNHV